jgi:rfaE bifunctional protein nucleotidyltransferase chain/domain
MVQVKLESKIKTIDELVDSISLLKKEGKTIVQCHGVFDLLHPGHIRHFESAKREGDVLVVTVTQDKYVAKGPGHPVFNERLRVESVAALECVDYVALNEWPTAVNTIKKLAPDVYCKGGDYADAKEDLTGKIYDEESAIKSIGGRMHFTDEITFSSTSLLNFHFDVFPEQARSFLQEFRNKYSSSDIINRFQALKNMKVLVIGDAIIDEYHYCSPMGKSPKENLIPAQYLYEETFAGGILAIANHMAGFCERVDMVTCLGLQNTYEGFISEHLKPNIGAKFFYRPDAPTIIKRRFVEVDILRKLFEVHFMDNNTSPESVTREACRYLESKIGDYDLVVVGDYGHGFLDREIIRVLCAQAKFLAVNVQTNSSNIGFNLITKYPRADYFCIDEAEIRLATHDKVSQIDVLLAEVAKALQCHRAVVTRGHRGSMVYDDREGFVAVPAFSREVVDRVGAGDTLLSVIFPCAAAGFPTELVGFIGNAVGALAIRIVGNRSPVEPGPLFKYIRSLLK